MIKGFICKISENKFLISYSDTNLGLYEQFEKLKK